MIYHKLLKLLHKLTEIFKNIDTRFNVFLLLFVRSLLPRYPNVNCPLRFVGRPLITERLVISPGGYSHT